MADEINLLSSTPTPTTSVSNSKSMVNNGVITIDSVTIALADGMIGCFSDTDYTSDSTGLLRGESHASNSSPKWSCKIAGKKYIFDNNGHCVDDAAGVETHHLYIVTTDLNTAEGNMTQAMTRAGQVGSKTVSVDSLTVRDHFAMCALEALIHKYNDPIECSTATCKYITDKAYEFANAMMVSSAEARTQYETPGGGGSAGTVDVPEGDLANNTEKLLNNIYKVLEALKSQLGDDGLAIKGFKDDFGASSDFTNTIPTSTTVQGTPSVNVNNSPTVQLAANSQVSVSNMPSQPIEIEGTVSVDNFPQSE